MVTSPAPLLTLQNLSITYPRSTQPAVQAVNLCLDAGDCVGLVGESGCGKSTIGRGILRLLPAGSQMTGRLDFEGTPVLDLKAGPLRRFRGEAVGLVFQDPMTRLDPLMTIGNHCAQTLKAHRPDLSPSQIRDRVGEVLDAVKISRDRVNQYPHEFSGGMRQRVAMALTLLLNPKLIVADEPTTSLDVTVAAQILEELTRLCRERSMGLILISHDLALVGQYCDRIAVMYDGEKVEEGPTQTVLHQPQHAYTQTLLRAALQLHGDRHLAPPASPPTESQSPASSPTSSPTSSSGILRLDRVCQHYTLERGLVGRLLGQQSQVIRAVDGLNLEVEAGETLGLVGESGCGKSTLCRTILQLIRPTSGTIEFEGRNLVSLSPQALHRQRRSMQMIFQDPRACLNPLMTLGASIADPLIIHGLAANQAAAEPQVLQMLERVGLSPGIEFYSRRPHQISGGQQQRVAIARALITRPRLLLCDEPVSMLDATVQAQVLDLMQELKREFALTYIFVTHDLWVARSFCDRVAVMSGGKIVEIGPTDQVFHDPQHPYTRMLLQAAPVLKAA
ncbi:MAG: dipeptide ABC transporter ATP-binding protein [Prochlorothrix sp.]|nr:ABC transporter ATP-binding protein [Prochlorothrix sp.]